MNVRVARMLVRLYPRAWRDRYGCEFEALLEDSGGFRTCLNVACSAFSERILPTVGDSMSSSTHPVLTLAKRPSAFLPLGMSVVALCLVLGHVAIYGIVHEADEGAVAHLWQLLMAAQLPIAAFFAIKWLPRETKPTLLVLALLAVVLLANFAAVFFLT